MTKKDFIALADALRSVNPSPEVIEAIVRFCKRQNSRFDEARWRGYLSGANGPSGGRRAKVPA